MENLSVFLLGILIFLLPINLGKHFIGFTSYVSGNLIDYLVPTIYLTDLIVVTLVLVLTVRYFRRRSSSGFRFQKLTLGLLVLFLVLLTASFLVNPTFPGIYKLLRLSLYILLTLLVSQQTFARRQLLGFGKWLSLSVLLQSSLGLYQFITQHSLCGYWCGGESTLNSLSYGITRDWFGGQYLILPYGTFPHPNILGGFLAVSLPLILYIYFLTKQKRFLVVSYLAFLILLLTMSQAAILVGFTGVSILLLRFVIPDLIASPGTSSGRVSGSQIVASGMTGFIPTSWLANLSFWRRLQLADVSLKMIMDKPWLGVGLNNFIPNTLAYGYNTGYPAFLQPVHNIYLLIAAESGLPALITFLLSVLCFLIFLFLSRRYLLVLVTLQILVLGFWDHYLWTTPQGLLMLWLTLGIGLSRMKVANATN